LITQAQAWAEAGSEKTPRPSYFAMVIAVYNTWEETGTGPDSPDEIIAQSPSLPTPTTAVTRCATLAMRQRRATLAMKF
jgi:hypothetical protein